jgi:hypothetical protein
MSVLPVTRGSINRKIAFQASPALKRKPISKITKAERAGGVAQVILLLTSKHLALSSMFNLQYPLTPKEKSLTEFVLMFRVCQQEY